MFNEKLKSRYADALINDKIFKFKKAANGSLTRGTCPACEEKEVFAHADRPWKVQCNRLTNCDYNETTASLYPEIVEAIIAESKNDPSNPNAVADTYMRLKRGFPTSTISNWYSQNYFDKNGIKSPTVRFVLDAERNVFWERLINQGKKDGQRQNMGGQRRKLNQDDPNYKELNGSLVKGLWWTPPGQVINDGDSVYLVEGIFHAIALHLAGYKVAATIGAGYFPSEAIKPYLGKNIIWVWGLDFDKAGITYMAKHRKHMDEMGETSTMALTGSDSEDWDDFYKNKTLSKDNPRFMNDCLYRGLLAAAKNVDRKAFVFFRERGRHFFVIDFNNALYSVSVDAGKENVSINDLKHLEDDALYDHKQVPGEFTKYSTIKKISPCFPQFLYAERNQLTRELSFFVRVDFSNGAPRVQESLDKNALESAKGFHKSLVGIAAGGAFYGFDREFRFIYDGWFRHKKASEEVKTINYMGYDAVFGGYVFDKFGIKNGQYIEKDEIGLIQYNDKKTKSTLKDINFVKPNVNAEVNWLNDIDTAFGINGLITIAYWFGTFFSEQLRKHYGWYPFLEMSGKPGTGKSTILEFLWKASGRSGRYEGINPTKYSKAGRGKAMTKLSGFPMVMVEGDTTEAKQAFDINEMKDAFNGGPVRGIGLPTGGSETIEPPFKCGFIAAQNAEVDCEKAMISRFVHLHFTESHFSTEGFDLLRKFRDMSHEDAAIFAYKSMTNETKIFSDIQEHYKKILNEFRAIDKISMVRIQEVHALICACFFALDNVFGGDVARHGNRVKNYLISRATERQERMSSDHPDIENFWQVFELINVTQEKDPDYHYTNKKMDVEVLNHSKDPELIAINLNEVAARADSYRHRLPLVKVLKKLLVHSTHYQYIGAKSINSKITEKAKHCLVFRRCQNFGGGSGKA